jgi:hypothetical protein
MAWRDPDTMASGEHSPREPLTPEEALRRLEERLDRASAAAERLMAEATGGPMAAAAEGSMAAAVEGSMAEAAEGPTAEAAEGPTAEAAESTRSTDSAAGRTPPPAGWESPANESSGANGDLDALVLLLRSLRDLIPPELQQRLVEALRELLQAIRALIDWYLERLERSRPEPAEVQDIPIL